jgi:galactonate dehydratase
LKITDAQVRCTTVDAKTHWVFLVLTTDNGLNGYGEALLGGSEPLLIDALQHAARKLLGRELLEASAPLATLADEHAIGLLEASVRSAIDQCLWDLRARAAGLPLYRLLGPRRRNEITLYANINRGTYSRSAAEFASRAAAAVSEGFGAVKLAPFDGVTRANVHTAPGQQLLAAAIERVRAVREAIGMNAMLMVDCHCRLDLAAALQFLDAVATLRLDWLEDVLPYHDLDGWQRLKAASRAPLAGGETARGIRDLLPFLQRGIWDVVMPDIRFFGGVSELLALAPLASQFQVALAPHNPRGPVATLASAHSMAGVAAFTMLEFQWGECDWRSDLVSGAERISGGALALGEEPGLGFELDEQILAAHPYGAQTAGSDRMLSASIR